MHIFAHQKTLKHSTIKQLNINTSHRISTTYRNTTKQTGTLMPDIQSIAAAIRSVPYLGNTIVVCFQKNEHSGFKSAHGLLTAVQQAEADKLQYPYNEIHHIARSLEVNLLLKRFSKKDTAADQFFSEENKQVVNNVLMPFVWKQTIKLLQLIKSYHITIYDARATWPNLYDDHTISFTGSPAEMNLEFSRSDEGTQYTLHVTHDDKKLELQATGTSIITEEPCYLLHNKKFYHFDEEVSGKLLKPFLQKTAIHIPKHIEHTYFNSFVKKNVNKLNITAKGFEIIDLDIEPVAMLSIEMNWQGNYGFVLFFDYDSRRIPANNKQKSFTRLESQADHFVFKRFQRQMDIEKHAREMLSKTGLNQNGAFFSLDKECPEKSIFMHFVNEHADHLKNNGFVIEQPGSDSYIIAKPEIILREYDKTDWFDLNIIIKIKDTEIPFLALKDHILNSDPIYTLPSGENFLIPEEWFERYKGLMLHGKTDGDTLKIDSRHFRMLEDFQLPEAKKLQEELLTEHTLEKPHLKNIKLRPYQLIGFAWMQKLSMQAMGGILADDMGLGKTLQVIALLSSYFSEKQETTDGVQHVKTAARPAGLQLSLFDDVSQDKDDSAMDDELYDHHLAAKPSKNPALLVVPTSIVHNWLNELKKHTPWLQVHEYAGPSRLLNRQIFENHHVIQTTYGTMRADIELLKAFHFSHAILDESHLVKNPFSKTARAAFSLQADYRFALTGTPVENKLSDIWSQMHFVNPGMLGGLSGFQRNYASPIEKDPEAFEGKQLMELLRPFIMRRTKARVASELPPITETTILCSMSKPQSELYEREKSRLRNVLLEAISSHEPSQPKHLLLLKALMKLRQIANHPRMANPDYDAESGKFEAVTSKFETLVAEKHKVLVFSSFVTHLEIMEAWCRQQGFAYAKLTGSTTKREAVISAFKKKDIPVFLISLKAGGVGLNLPEAGYVFLLDPWWNPAAELQAINRTHRIGQDKNVMVYRFISKDTVEEKIIRLQEKKRKLATTVIKAGEFVKNISTAEMEALLQ
jgi:SNF2 family DNA or RNA helicase